MEDRVLRVLQWEKICSSVENETTNAMSLELAKNLLPMNDIDEIKFAQDTLDEIINLYVKNGFPRMGGLKDLTTCLARVEIGGVLSNSELLQVADALRIARNLLSYHKNKSGRNQNDEVLLIDTYFNDIMDDKNLENDISEAIISDDEVSDNASVNLRNIRRQIATTHSKVRDVLNSIISGGRYEKALQDAIITMRDGRYVVPVKAEHKGDISGIVHDVSSSGATIFIEPSGVVDANNKIRELVVQERDEINKILSDFSLRVANDIYFLRENQKSIVDIDFLFAKAKYSLQIDGIYAKFNTKKYVNIVKGRHPLIDPKKVVPITIRIGGDEFQTLVITGPNTGGKTVSLKTIGLFTLMGMSGLQIPASFGTTLYMVDNIYADIGDEQSIEQSLSTFSSHMTNIVKILEKVTDNSLVLFDELGAGTDPTEGAALAIAILKYTKSMGALTVATTHYSEIKIYALQTDGVCNASCEFDINTLSPTYNLLIGVPGKSNAFAISKRLGLPDFIIEQAKEHITEENIAFEDILNTLESDKKQVAQELSQAEVYKRQFENLKKDVEIEKEKLQEKRSKIQENAKEEAAKILKQAKAEADEIIKEIRKAKENTDKNELNKSLEEITQKLNKKIKNVSQAQVKQHQVNANPPKNLIIGNVVHIIDIDQEGSVVSPPNKDGNVILQVGIMKINSNITNLRLKPCANQSKFVPKTRKSGLSSAKDNNATSEIDLRGYNLDDAVFMTENFIDSAVMGHLSIVSIIHGKGTGVLRSGIHQMLKNNPSVKSYRLGTFGEGENGVTIVELK